MTDGDDVHRLIGQGRDVNPFRQRISELACAWGEKNLGMQGALLELILLEIEAFSETKKGWRRGESLLPLPKGLFPRQKAF